MKGLRGSTETVIRVRDATPGTDKYGDPIEPDTPGGETPIDGCLVAPLRSPEDTQLGRAGVVIGWTVVAPPGTDVTRRDQVKIRGVLCDVEGEVADWGDGGVMVNAQRAEG